IRQCNLYRNGECRTAAGPQQLSTHVGDRFADAATGIRRPRKPGHHGTDKLPRKAAATAGSVMNADEKITEGAHGFLSGGGELGQLIRQFDWAATSIGAPETWPQNLRMALRIML